MRDPVARKRFEGVLDVEEGEGVNQIWEKTWDSFVESNRISLWMDKRPCKVYTDMVVGMKKLRQ